MAHPSNEFKWSIDPIAWIRISVLETLLPSPRPVWPPSPDFVITLETRIRKREMIPK